jgi:membrane protease YdiL (CAAX protease family)
MQTTSSPTSSRPWSERNPFIGLTLWLAIALLFITQAFAFAGELPEDVFYEYDLALISLVNAAILVPLTVAIALLFPDRLGALGLRGFASRWLWIAFAVVAASLILAGVLEQILHGGEEQGLLPQRWDPDRADVFVVNGVVAATTVALTEELFFRGLGFTALSLFGATVAIVGTAVFFALAHGVLAGVPSLLVFALCLAWLRHRSGSIWPGMIAHGAYNALAVLLVYVEIA